MDQYQKLLLANKAMVEERLELGEDYFSSMAEGQSPEFLWIGCSDARVPAEDLTGSGPGELFVHRNIANLVPENDLNVLSVIQYAVEALKVKHVIVCGHYGCGGIKHGMMDEDLGLLGSWLDNIRSLYRENLVELDSIGDGQARWDRMVEISVKRQVRNVAATDTIQKAWNAGQGPEIHGWVYDLRSGYLKELETIAPVSASQ